MGILGLLGLPLCCYVGSVPFVLSVLFVVSVVSVVFSARAALAPRGYARIAGSVPFVLSVLFVVSVVFSARAALAPPYSSYALSFDPLGVVI